MTLSNKPTSRVKQQSHNENIFDIGGNFFEIGEEVLQFSDLKPGMSLLITGKSKVEKLKSGSIITFKSEKEDKLIFSIYLDNQEIEMSLFEWKKVRKSELTLLNPLEMWVEDEEGLEIGRHFFERLTDDLETFTELEIEPGDFIELGEVSSKHLNLFKDSLLTGDILKIGTPVVLEDIEKRVNGGVLWLPIYNLRTCSQVFVHEKYLASLRLMQGRKARVLSNLPTSLNELVTYID